MSHQKSDKIGSITLEFYEKKMDKMKLTCTYVGDEHLL